MADDQISPETAEVTPETTVVVEATEIPEPPDTTVVVEETPPNDPTDALDFSERVNRIVDERVNQRMATIEERIAGLQPIAPEVVVVTPEPAPAPPPVPAPAPEPDQAPKPENDEPPRNDHPYFKKRWGKR